MEILQNAGSSFRVDGRQRRFSNTTMSYIIKRTFYILSIFIILRVNIQAWVNFSHLSFRLTLVPPSNPPLWLTLVAPTCLSQRACSTRVTFQKLNANTYARRIMNDSQKAQCLLVQWSDELHSSLDGNKLHYFRITILMCASCTKSQPPKKKTLL